MEVYIFKKPGFKKRQSQKLKESGSRASILVSCDLNDDPKIGLLHSQKDYTLLPLYLEVLFNLDLDTEEWEISAQAFKDWFRKRFDVNNRFNIEQRVEWLSNHGLIEFKRVPNDVLTSSLSGSNEILTGSLLDPKDISLPIREGKKPRRSTRDLTNQNNQNNQGSSCRRTSCTDEQMEVAKFIFSGVKTLNPQAKEPNWDSWGNEIRLMVERDNRSLEAIKELFAWANSDPFWKVNILSPGKLREKWDQLMVKKQNQNAYSTNPRQVVPASERITGELDF